MSNASFTLHPNQEVSKIHICKRLFALSAPIFIGSASSIVTVLINSVIVGYADKTALLLIGLFLPVSFLITALVEGVRAPMIYISSTYGKEYGVLFPMLILMGFSLCVVAIFILIFNGIGPEILTGRTLSPIFLSKVNYFVFFMLLSSACLIIGQVSVSALIGFGMVKRAMGLIFIANILNILVTSLFAYYMAYGVFGIVFGMFAGGVFLLSGSLFVFFKHNMLLRKRMKELVKPTLENLYKVSVPVFLSYIILFGYYFILNRLLVLVNPDQVAGFGMAFRVQNFLILPAVSVGSGLAVLFGHMKIAPSSQKQSFLDIYLLINISMYVLIALCIWLLRYRLALILSSEQSIQESISSYFTFVAPSYVLFDPMVGIFVFFDQVNKALLLLMINLITAVIGVFFILFAFYMYRTSSMLFAFLSIGNLLSAIFVICVFTYQRFRLGMGG